MDSLSRPAVLRMKTSLAATLLMASGLALAAEPALPVATACALQPFSATYESQGYGFTLEINRKLEKAADGTWTASSGSSKLFFSVSESTRFRIKGNTLVPLEYHYKQTPGSRDQDWLFDYNANKVSNRTKEKPWTLPIVAGAHDRMSYQLQMGLDLQCQGDKPREMAFPVPDRTSYDQYRWAVRGHETLDTALGRIDTVKLEQLRDSNKRQDFVWVAPAWGYQMVQQRHIEKGDSADTKITSLTLNGVAVKKR